MPRVRAPVRTDGPLSLLALFSGRPWKARYRAPRRYFATSVRARCAGSGCLPVGARIPLLSSRRVRAGWRHRVRGAAKTRGRRSSRSGSTGSTTGSHRNRKSGCRSTGEILQEWRRRVRWSGRKCNAGHRPGRARQWPPSGRRQGRPCRCRSVPRQVRRAAAAGRCRCRRESARNLL